ncbi:hypothetical protein D6C86_02299 [Aureobasidium pullulans]|uniref:Uncharacterized protein n=1 Tax=Aureobasidium pullulans TaxID=5580 RepID=A0A4S9WHQ9_AURPU|nr:hypothetical protein D6C94_02698 [Aureobasidium pullulans]THZ47643.1 hypothetical protein D6C87_01257 [Aureobasidium pullulans]THZ64885.1 hypothetical protein D6C86_02299 [Aureobasidium pullulans]THZ83450.1 hypothetical protein D6C88_05920 [Aureobasidium pullulans]
MVFFSYDPHEQWKRVQNDPELIAIRGRMAAQRAELKAQMAELKARRSNLKKVTNESKSELLQQLFQQQAEIKEVDKRISKIKAKYQNEGRLENGDYSSKSMTEALDKLELSVFKNVCTTDINWILNTSRTYMIMAATSHQANLITQSHDAFTAAGERADRLATLKDGMLSETEGDDEQMAGIIAPAGHTYDFKAMSPANSDEDINTELTSVGAMLEQKKSELQQLESAEPYSQEKHQDALLAELRTMLDPRDVIQTDITNRLADLNNMSEYLQTGTQRLRGLDRDSQIKHSNTLYTELRKMLMPTKTVQKLNKGVIKLHWFIHQASLNYVAKCHMHFILAAIPVVNISSISSTDPDGSWTIKPWQLEGSRESAKAIVECNKTMAKKLASAYGHPHVLYGAMEKLLLDCDTLLYSNFRLFDMALPDNVRQPNDIDDCIMPRVVYKPEQM